MLKSGPAADKNEAKYKLILSFVGLTKNKIDAREQCDICIVIGDGDCY